jgi:hypothetical protein
MIVPKDVLHFIIHIPAYIHHFHHHQTQHGRINLVNFIKEHSMGTDHHKKDEHNHDDLPSGHQHSSDCNQSLTFYPFYFKQSINFHLPSTKDKKIVAQYFFCSSEFPPSIWQPPKMS